MKENQKLYRQAKAERIQHHQTSSSTNAKGSNSRQETEKRFINSTQNNKVNGNGIILINNYLKCKWVECPKTKDKDWLNGYKNKTPIYVVYKRPTSKQGTHTD